MKRRLRAIRLQYGNGKMSLEKCREVFMSYMGLMSHCDATRLRDKILDEFVLVRRSVPDDE